MLEQFGSNRLRARAEVRDLPGRGGQQAAGEGYDHAEGGLQEASEGLRGQVKRLVWTTASIGEETASRTLAVKSGESLGLFRSPRTCYGRNTVPFRPVPYVAALQSFTCSARLGGQLGSDQSTFMFGGGSTCHFLGLVLQTRFPSQQTASDVGCCWGDPTVSTAQGIRVTNFLC